MDQIVSGLNGPNPRLQHNERERSVIPDFVSLHEHLRLLIITIFLTQLIPHPDDIRVDPPRLRRAAEMQGMAIPQGVASRVTER